MCPYICGQFWGNSAGTCAKPRCLHHCDDDDDDYYNNDDYDDYDYDYDYDYNYDYDDYNYYHYYNYYNYYDSATSKDMSPTPVSLPVRNTSTSQRHQCQSPTHLF